MDILEIDEYINQNLAHNEFQAGLKRYIYSNGVLKQYKEKTLTGKYLLITVCGFNGGDGNMIAVIYCEI